MKRKEVLNRFIEVYGETSENVHVFFAPGRVNIIGEHQDYNGGHVFPAALTMGIFGAYRIRKDNTINLYSENMSRRFKVKLTDNLQYSKTLDWANYPLGIIDYLQQEGYTLPGLDLYFNGNLPLGSGLSSSACILDLTGYMLKTLLGEIEMDRSALAQMAQKVEYNYIGVKVGIMDQFVISHGQKDCGVLLDCTTLKFRIVPIQWGEYSLIIMNTNKPRDLVNSDFNKRKEECDAALECIRQVRPLAALALATEDNLNLIKDGLLYKRARHVVSENRRVLKFVDALETGNLATVADLLNDSHISLRDDYEVSCKELNSIVEIARKQNGCVASRMTGAGFGGCAIALVENACVNEFKEKVYKDYTEVTNIKPSLYNAYIGEGVRAI